MDIISIKYDEDDEDEIYKSILVEKFFSIKSNHKINKLEDLQNEVEYLLYYLNKNQNNSPDILNYISELKDLYSIITFAIKLAYIKNVHDIDDINKAYQ